ncbi:hypothetical protein EVAR_43247_1 [Eumeta japonica]|uniref:Uncharacterized protein n=1 Tax=Eumeta variegata TaxID=151549 RepID=A0A4C1WUC8_EUMVA|nr:hypothetical protein EVAR_43247_1 [Eumeta japonica]
MISPKPIKLSIYFSSKSSSQAGSASFQYPELRENIHNIFKTWAKTSGASSSKDNKSAISSLETPGRPLVRRAPAGAGGGARPPAPAPAHAPGAYHRFSISTHNRP